jgi:hypothetical protein
MKCSGLHGLTIFVPFSKNGSLIATDGGHGALGPGVPDPPVELELVPKAKSRHRLAAGAVVLAKSILGGLHHE